ncbi:hypothetical protein WMY93_007076 [Mugilogobius chulae]|uniref:DRBM domain-containing protein n=1 Tax=Mugilogobius chulae TaxID=88201 RepID=A0AAW0PPC9_9GOBI
MKDVTGFSAPKPMLSHPLHLPPGRQERKEGNVNKLRGAGGGDRLVINVEPVKHVTAKIYCLAQKNNLSVHIEEMNFSSEDFRVSLTVGRLTVVGRGCTREQAEAHAEFKMLRCLQRSRVLTRCFFHENSICFLNELAFRNKIRHPLYRLLDSGKLSCGWVFLMQCIVGSLSAEGVGGSKKEAKQKAADNMAELMGLTTCALLHYDANHDHLRSKNTEEQEH